MKSFSEFLENKIYESEPIVFQGKGKDPYQYKIEGDKTFYAKKSSGELEPNSDKWVEQTSRIGKNAIKDLYSRISSVMNLDEDFKVKVIQLQEVLNGAKKSMPKLWTLPLKTDGIPGWKTAWSWYMVMIIYPQMENVKDPIYYSRESFLSFKDPNNWIVPEGSSAPEVKNALDFFQKYIIDSRWTVEGKVDFNMILEETKQTIDFMNGKLLPGSEVSYLYCTQITKSIPTSLKAESIIVRDNCPLKTIPPSTECKTISIYSETPSSQFKLPKIKTNSVEVRGPVTLEEGWDYLEFLSVGDSPEGTPCNKNFIPKSLKEIGALYLNSQEITAIPDNLQVGNMKSKIITLEKKPLNLLQITPQVEYDFVTMKKKPWIKRIFSKEKYYHVKESENFGNLDIEGCYNIKTLPKGLSVLGDFVITNSGLESFKDEEIREVCDIKGNIIRTTVDTGSEEI